MVVATFQGAYKRLYSFDLFIIINRNYKDRYELAFN